MRYRVDKMEFNAAGASAIIAVFLLVMAIAGNNRGVETFFLIMGGVGFAALGLVILLTGPVVVKCS